MKASVLVGRFKRIQNLDVYAQRNTIQLARDYEFRQMSLLEKGLRFVGVPQFITVMLTFVGLFTISHDPIYYLPIVVVSGCIGWLVEQWLYHMMISRGIDKWLDKPQEVYYQEEKPVNVLDVIHRCGVPPNW